MQFNPPFPPLGSKYSHLPDTTDGCLRPSQPQIRTGARPPGSLAGRRLPQLHLVSVRIHDPAKLAILGLVNFLEYVAAFFAQSFDECVEIRDAVVDHEGGGAGRKLIAISRTNGPGGCARNGFAVTVGPIERRATPYLNVDSEMLFVPGL